MSRAGRRALAYRLRYQEGWRLERIAAELNTTPGAVGQLLRRMRKEAERWSPNEPWPVYRGRKVVRAYSLSDVFQV